MKHSRIVSSIAKFVTESVGKEITVAQISDATGVSRQTVKRNMDKALFWSYGRVTVRVRNAGKNVYSVGKAFGGAK